ncbi:hypothetical protein ACFE04_020104 [Oxalis oulophora]
MAVVSVAIQHLIIRPPPPSTSTFFLLRPLCISNPPFLPHNSSQKPPLYTQNYFTLPSSSPPPSPSSFTRKNNNFIFSSFLSSTQAIPTNPIENNNDDEELVSENSDDEVVKNEILSVKRSEKLTDVSLTVKEKKDLASYANSLGKKLKSQLVGKSGVTQSVASSFVENLESNELLKIKIHRTCPGELDDVVSQLEELTGSVVVGKIGRTVILYRPSITKLKVEEKKKENMKIYLSRRSSKPFVPRELERKPFSLSKGRGRKPFSVLKGGQERKPFKRGGRGLSRV